MDIEEVQQKLGEYLASDFEHGPFSDTSFARAEVEPDGMVSLFASESESAWPVASFDAPQLAEWLMPLVRRAQAEALREYRVALSENPSADNWDKRGFLDDIEDWTQMLAHEAHYIEQEVEHD